MQRQARMPRIRLPCMSVRRKSTSRSDYAATRPCGPTQWPGARELRRPSVAHRRPGPQMSRSGQHPRATDRALDGAVDGACVACGPHATTLDHRLCEGLRRSHWNCAIAASRHLTACGRRGRRSRDHLSNRANPSRAPGPGECSEAPSCDRVPRSPSDWREPGPDHPRK